MSEFKDNLEQKAEQLVEALKEQPQKLKDLTAESSVLKEVLGEDGKLSSDDLSRVVDLAKEKFASLTEGVKAKVAEESAHNETLKNVTEGASNFASNVKTGAEDLLGKAKDTVLGEDGKLDMDDVNRVAGEAVEGAKGLFDKAKETVLGEDGKLDASDVGRVAGEAVEGAKDLLDKAKGLFSKKEGE
ncbi:MAG: hypothetical protein J6D29_02810 [Solobacterium sp.]|nr:hypothetical protein [Solobacterium sp.]